MVSSPQLTFFVIARSALLFLVVAGLAYLWMSTISQALRRADRAEFIAELEWRERARQQDMEEAVQVILNVHTRIANGDLDARVPTHEHHLLWQVGVALNNLLTRFKSTSQSERTLQRVVQEIAMLRAALREHQGGQALRWYPTEKNILQPLSDDLGRALSQRIAFPAPSARPAPTTGSPLMTPSWSNPVVQAAPPQFPIAMPTPVAQRAPQQFPISLPGPAGQTVPQFPIAMPDSPEALGKADDTLFMPTDPMMRGILS